MKKFGKILLLLSILLFTSFTFCYNYSFADNTTASDSSGSITTTVSSIDTANDDFLSPTNIINIFLIAIGIVLILLAIAILIRLKK